MNRDVNINFRVARDERKCFAQACVLNDIEPSHALREFMAEYIQWSKANWPQQKVPKEKQCVGIEAFLTHSSATREVHRY